MMKKLVCAFALVCGAMVAQADFLWWQVEPVAGREFSLADLYATDGTTETCIDSVQPVDVNSSGVGTKVETVSTDITGYTSSEYSFFVELVTYSDTTYETVTDTQRMDAVPYNDLVSGNYITAAVTGPGLPSAPASGFNIAGGGSGDVPEPTSGMLFLLGGALMALRRRRRA